MGKISHIDPSNMSGLMNDLRIDQKEILRRKEWLEFTEEDEANLTAIDHIAQGYATEVVDSLYEHFLKFKELRFFFEDSHFLNKLKELQKQFFLRITKGNYDNHYFEGRLRVGVVHANKKIEVKWYLGAYGFYMRGIAKKLFKSFEHNPEQALSAFLSLSKLLFIDMELAIEAYMYERELFIRRKENYIVELRNALYIQESKKKILSLEQRSHIIMESAICGMFITDVNGIILDLNQEAARIFGLDNEQAKNVDFRRFIHPTEQEYATVQFQKVLIDKKIGPNEGRIQQPGGAVIDVEFTSIYVENENEKIIISILNDVTNLNRLRTQTILADKLATVGTLTASIIHEINNPMTYVVSNLKFMSELISSPQVDIVESQKLISKLQNIVNETIKGADRIQHIIKDLKGFARIDRDDLSIVNINDVLDAAINMAYPQFKDKAEIKKDFATVIPSLVLNRNKLHQVFLNILMNAFQAMNSDVTRKNIVSVQTFCENKQICIRISDTGKGIPADVLPKIFDPFFTTKPVGIGTGLGLSISSEIINNLGGEISVESKVGQGTTFSIYLPIILVEDESQPEVSVEQFDKIAFKKILLVDDEPSILIILERLLGSDNQIVKAQSGRAALDIILAQDGNFDFMVCDLSMPDVNGADLYRFIHSNYPSLADRMIFITGGIFTSSLDEFISTVKNPTIEKPFTKEQLLKAANTVLART